MARRRRREPRGLDLPDVDSHVEITEPTGSVCATVDRNVMICAVPPGPAAEPTRPVDPAPDGDLGEQALRFPPVREVANRRIAASQLAHRPDIRGKSTLLLAIAGLLPPSGGTVYTHGQPPLLGVNAALMNDLTGERNVVLGCLAGGMSRAEARAHYDEIVDFSGVNDNGDFISLPMRT